MASLSSLLATAAIIGFFALVFLVIFGQVTVRKLKKNPETRDYLGVEYLSGWSIINVAQALSLPKSWTSKLEQSPLSGLHANAEVLRKHTSRLDRILAITFYVLFMTSGLSMALLALLDVLGFFEN